MLPLIYVVMAFTSPWSVSACGCAKLKLKDRRFPCGLHRVRKDIDERVKDRRERKFVSLMGILFTY